ncbi:hypothetical protein CYMTET_13396 [Cymbomonas tetramitiformis]|uniref:Thioesterase domain-containing protein n=1 Tax=Cymbomonas tetramitiformis TaxID=36881 RepID=A0AAE0LBF8_9CHLO|nr:hypothetical protein CYMTET_13396 [Cymbomonas tetramitiformis]
MAGQPGKYGKWINQGPAHLERPEVPPDSVQLRLFAIPQAGCGAWAYHGWSKQLPEWVEVMPVELPGRNTRMMEPKQTSMKQLVLDIVDELTPYFREVIFLSSTYLLVAKSSELQGFGAWLVYEVAKVLQQRGEPLPAKLYVACNRAPHFHDGVITHFPMVISDLTATISSADLQI